MATDRSDLDVYVVLDGPRFGEGELSPADSLGFRPGEIAVDEVQVTLDELESVPSFGAQGWWFRWSFAWAPVLLDRTGARIASAARRQARITPAEAESILVQHYRLDGWLNYAYRSLKNDRDGRRLESRLDAAESIPWLLDVIFVLAGRVRPYNKYLAWEADHHPLPDWPGSTLPDLLSATLDGDPSAIRTTFERVEACCAAFDRIRSTPILTPVISAWGDELSTLRG